MIPVEDGSVFMNTNNVTNTHQYWLANFSEGGFQVITDDLRLRRPISHPAYPEQILKMCDTVEASYVLESTYKDWKVKMEVVDSGSAKQKAKLKSKGRASGAGS